MGRFDGSRTAALLLLTAATSFACSKSKDNSDNPPPTDTAAQAAANAPAMPAPTDTAAAKPTDPQIADIGVTANTIDVDLGKDAEKRATNAEVKAFAREMVTDHSAANKQASALAAKLKLTPEDNPTSQALKSAADSVKKDLDTKKGADFDKAYIAHEVQFHQQVLDALDKTLIPNTQNAELKSFLQQVRGVVQGHLQKAQGIQSKLGA